MSESDFAASLFAAEFRVPTGLRVWDGLEPSRRWGIYRNNVLSSLLDALADTFPVTRQLVGNDFFRAMAMPYVRSTPPRMPVLAYYGDSFPKFIAHFEPARPVPYLADLAALEWARTKAYHAADVTALSHEAVVAALSSGDDAVKIIVTCHPSVSVTNSPYAVMSLWAAHQSERSIKDVAVNVAESAIVLREELDVLVVRLRPNSAIFVSALLEGIDLESAAALAHDTAYDFNLVETLNLLVRHQAVVSIEKSPRGNV